MTLPLPVTQLRLMSDMLWIRMSAVLVKIETFDFPVLRNTQGAGRFHRVHENHGYDEYGYTDGRITFDLGDELVPATAIEQTRNYSTR